MTIHFTTYPWGACMQYTDTHLGIQESPSDCRIPQQFISSPLLWVLPYREDRVYSISLESLHGWWHMRLIFRHKSAGQHFFRTCLLLNICGCRKCSKLIYILISWDFFFLLVLGTKSYNKVLGQFSVSPNQRLSDVVCVFLMRCVVYWLMV